MNNLVLIQDGKVVVSSRQVAEVFEKEHSKVLRSIEGIISETPIMDSQEMYCESTYKTEGNNKSYPEYIMNKLGFSVLTMGFTGSKALQWKIEYAKAFEAMEDKLRNSFAIPQTYAQALLLASQQAQVIEEQTKVITITKPKAEYFDALVSHGLSLSFRDTAKELGIGERKFIEYLSTHKFIYKAGSKWMPYAKYIGRYFEVKEYNTVSHTGNQCLVTVNGREKLRKAVGQ